MEQDGNTSARIYARPVDRSLEAYKAFILAILCTVNPSASDDKSEEWWAEAWQEFWAAADAAGSKDIDKYNRHTISQSSTSVLGRAAPSSVKRRYSAARKRGDLDTTRQLIVRDLSYANLARLSPDRSLRSKGFDDYVKR